MRLLASKLSFTVILTLSLGTFSYAAEPIIGDVVNEALIAQVEAENAALTKTESEPSRLPASVQDTKEPKR